VSVGNVEQHEQENAGTLYRTWITAEYRTGQQLYPEPGGAGKEPAQTQGDRGRFRLAALLLYSHSSMFCYNVI
jgi:hypothetical protein